jgi:hypothetical protein
VPKSLLDLHPLTIRDAQRDGIPLETLFDLKGYRLKPIVFRTNEGDDEQPKLFNRQGRPYIFHRMCRGDNKL